MERRVTQIGAYQQLPTPVLDYSLADYILASAWQQWLEYQTMLINENNLNLFEESSQSYLKQQMETYFFSEDGDVDKIDGYTPK